MARAAVHHGRHVPPVPEWSGRERGRATDPAARRRGHDGRCHRSPPHPEQLQQETIEALENLRDLARGIYPPLLGDKGLETALVAQARKSPIPIEVHANGSDRNSKEVEAAVYFCVLEALENVAKYAKAERAKVRLFASDDALTFEVEDDGIGFEPATTSGSGLSNMRDRLEALGGELDIRSSVGRGTTVTGIVPSSGQQPAAVSAHGARPLP